MVAIEIHDVSKKYRRHTDRPLTTTLKSYFLYDLWCRRVGRENVIWALHNVDLHVDKGTTLGVIGRNGAGKSTLLKLLSGILRPDTGTVCAHGKVAALIELGAGFHPELTGRENIIINGIILGLSKKEIRGKLEEIVAFAELQPYIDEPVRTYSSGMYMRLGFSVAAHVDPEILLIDEVFAVGDAAFSRKCMERMRHFKRVGKTMVLVTHDLDTVRDWCDKAVWLHEGMLKMEGEPGMVTDAYMKEVLRSEPYHER